MPWPPGGRAVGRGFWTWTMFKVDSGGQRAPLLLRPPPTYRTGAGDRGHRSAPLQGDSGGPIAAQVFQLAYAQCCNLQMFAAILGTLQQLVRDSMIRGWLDCCSTLHAVMLLPDKISKKFSDWRLRIPSGSRRRPRSMKMAENPMLFRFFMGTTLDFSCASVL